MQHSIDLLPDSLRAKSQAGMRAGRMIAGAMIAIAVLVVTAGHSLVALVQAQEEMFESSTDAEEIFAAEARIHELRAALKRTQAYMDSYNRIAFPVNVDAGARLASRSPRSRGVEPSESAAARVLQGEVSGFAARDSQIAELVTRLSQTPPFRDVTLDFSRTRDVHGRDAREFRLSFRIDLDAMFSVKYREPDSSLPGEETGRASAEAAHVAD
jgi:hypothetical protein